MWLIYCIPLAGIIDSILFVLRHMNEMTTGQLLVNILICVVAVVFYACVFYALCKDKMQIVTVVNKLG